MILMGSGTYGCVYKTRELRAIKKSDPYYSWVALREMINMRYISLFEGNSMIKLFDANYESQTITMELAAYDLRKWNCEDQTPSKRGLIIRKVIKAVYLLHQMGLTHADLKTSNIVLTHSDEVKLIDFGFTGPGKWAFTDYTTPIYRDRYNSKSYQADIYSLGIILIELMLNMNFESPPTSYHIKEVTHSIHKDFRYFIRSMTGEPRKRPSIEQVVDKFNIRDVILPSLKLINHKSYELPSCYVNWMVNMIKILNLSGPHRIRDFFDLLLIFNKFADFISDMMFYGLAIMYIYSSYFHNPINYPTIISFLPTYYSRYNRRIKLAQKIDIVLSSDEFIINLFSRIS